MALNFDNYNQQVASIQGQLAALQQKQFPTMNSVPFTPQVPFQSEPVSQQLKYVDGPERTIDWENSIRVYQSMYRE